MSNFKHPPKFTDSSAPAQPAEPPREKTPPAEDIWGSVTSVTPDNSQWQLTPYEQHQQMMIQRQSIHFQPGVQEELQLLRMQNAQAQQLVGGYESRLQEMDARIRQYEQQIMQFVTV
jgi:hypothetical protein